MLLKRKKPGYEESKIKKTLTGIIYPVAFGVLIFILWQTEALHRLVNTTEAILPTPSHIGRIIVDNFPILWGNLVATLMPTLIGLFLGSAKTFCKIRLTEKDFPAPELPNIAK